MQISQPPSRTQRIVDLVFRRLCQALAWLSVFLVALIILRIAFAALPAMREHGLQFITGTVWDPNQGQYAILSRDLGHAL
jgi:phosphate transport system permease protein